MGRKHYTGRIPQHSRHARERSRGIESPQPFGVHRAVEPATALRIARCLRELQAEGELPAGMKIEKRPHLALVPLRMVGVQLQQGIIRKDPQRMRRRLEDMFADRQPATVEADIADIRVHEGQHLQLLVDSRVLEAEQAKVVGELSCQGVKGLYRMQQESRLGIRLGYSGNPLNGEEQRQVVDSVFFALDEVHHLEEPVPLGAWATYPKVYDIAV